MRYLVTGGAGFIGSHIVESLCAEGAEVTVLDDLSTGNRANIAQLEASPGFRFIEGSITDPADCALACEDVERVFHEAALTSVPASLDNPLSVNTVNVTGTLNIFLAARDAGVKRVVWASSTAVYGDPEVLPTPETVPLDPLSPYAASKAAGEAYAAVFANVYGLPVVSLRYFNVYGPRQDPRSPYAAVIPLFVSALLGGERPIVFGDGAQTRDFIHVRDVVRANMLASSQPLLPGTGGVFNIGSGKAVSVNDLAGAIAEAVGTSVEPKKCAARTGDIRDSVADIRRAREILGFEPLVGLTDGVKDLVDWYRHQ